MDTSPLDTLQLALAEAKSWKVAQIIPEAEEDLVQSREAANRDGGRTSVTMGCCCQVDASWTQADKMTGLGFVLMENGKRILMGMKNCYNVTSPLQAEAEALTWAMKRMLEQGHRSVLFETDCNQLVKLFQGIEEWPVMVEVIVEIRIISTSFSSFSIAFLPRGMNQRADCLAKAARARPKPLSLLCVETPVWLAHVASLLE